MAKLLYIKSSPRTYRSHSHLVAEYFLEIYKKQHQQKDVIITLDLFASNLPEFDNIASAGKYAIIESKQKNNAQQKRWQQIELLIEQFKSADKYLLSVPMWNFSIPYKLKQYIDIINQPGYTFSASAEGYKGLIINKPLCVVYSSGGFYSPESEMDMQKKYIQMIFSFMGFENIKNIICDRMMADADTHKKSIDAAKQQARQLAAIF